MPESEQQAERLSLYLPRILQQHLVDDPSGRWWTADGTVAFVDISGFTKLSERLARKGREGSEQITEVIGNSFESLLAVAYENGASLLKFGGDALLLWFQDAGHATRACRAAVLMRRVLRKVGRIEVPGARVTLRMSQGVHTGEFHFFAVGASHVEFLATGPAWSRAVAMEHEATAGEILVSPETAALLPDRCLGNAKGPGVLLVREPPGFRDKLPLVPRPKIPPETLARCLSPAIRPHVTAGGGASEHRPVTIAFIRIEGTDPMIERDGPAATAEALHQLVSVVEAATEEQGIALLASDVDADGGKLILTAGAPSVTGDDEERMLLALRKILDAGVPIPIRIGVNRGAIFAGDIGPFYRRTYTVMGDAVNLAARLMAKAEPGHIYATADVLERSNTLFATTPLEPFLVKGKAQPIKAWAVGSAVGSRARQVTLQPLPLIGRDAERWMLREALDGACRGAGRLVEVVGEAGAGKTRLLEALREEAQDFSKQHVTCEAYTASTPYVAWRELLRELFCIGREDPDAVVVERLREIVATRLPDLRPWLPLLAAAFAIELPPTPEVDMLAEKNRRSKLHEVAGRFLECVLSNATLIEFENAHYMDEPSAEFLAYLTGELSSRPWLIGVARRPEGAGFKAPDGPAVTRLPLGLLAADDTLRLTRIANEEHPLPLHVLQVVAQRSGGNPQFLRDLLRAAMETGGVDSLPDSAEAAAMARIDALSPEDRAVVRKAAVLGLTFHPRMLAWFTDDADGIPPGPATWGRLREFFDDDGDGYLRFRRSLLRDAAYQGLPYRLRRKLHKTVAERLEEEMEQPEEGAGILSLHYFEAGAFQPAWRYAEAAGKRADSAFAYVEAAGLYQRAVEAGKRLPDVRRQDLVPTYVRLGDAWYRASEFDKASGAYAVARRIGRDRDPLLDSELLLKQSRVEEKLGQYPKALRWASRARTAIEGTSSLKALRQAAQTSAWYCMVLQQAGKIDDAVRWAKRTIAEARAADDQDALGSAHIVQAWACRARGEPGVEQQLRLALEAFQRAGNLVRQPAVLSNLGIACQLDGRWDEALEYYERARDESIRIGNNVNAAIARLNIAEILSDRGEWEEAEAHLKETLPFWKAAKYRFFLAQCQLMLGRLTLGAGRIDEALHTLQDAKANMLQVGAAGEVPDVEARIAECLVHQGNAEAALEIVAELLRKAETSRPIARLGSLLERIRALASLSAGNLADARAAAEASLAKARARKEVFETALTLRVLIAIDGAAGVSPGQEVTRETEALLAGLKVRRAPTLPAGLPVHSRHQLMNEKRPRRAVHSPIGEVTRTPKLRRRSR